MAMKIVIGSIQCEGNSLTPIHTHFEDFDYAVGGDMLEKVQVVEYLKEQGCEIIPTVYAHALPGGAIIKDDFLQIAQELINRIPVTGIDGIWLYLHGAMYVEKIGSGDTWLLKKIREKVGFRVPISVAMDFHADNTDEFPSLVNCVTGFRTAPHCDHKETQIRAARTLLHCIRHNVLPQPQMARADVVICGDAVQTALEPLKSIMAAAERFEREIPGMLGVQVFNGQPWIDEPYMGPSFVVTHASEPETARKIAEELADMFYRERHAFRFLTETAMPEEAVRMAMEAKEKQVFLSDSGDNTTAGASGDNAFMINLLQQENAQNVLVAGIADKQACRIAYAASVGDRIMVQVGGSLDKNAESATLTGTLVHKGDILSYTGGNAGPSCTLDCGNMTVVITANRAAMCRPDIFASIELDYKKFKIVVVKLGYLFPELAKEAERSILVFTPGSSTERLEDMHMQKIRRPMFPLDDDFK